MNKAFIDTLFVVALINSRDQYHSLALTASNKYESYSLVTTDCILLEIGNALSRNFKQPAIDIIDESTS